MQKIMSPDIKLTEAMKYQIKEVEEKINSVFGGKVSLHFILEKKSHGRIALKLGFLICGEEFFFEAKGLNFYELIAEIRVKAVRAIRKKKERIYNRRTA